MHNNKIFNAILNRIPSTTRQVMHYNFLTIDTRGRIIIEECDIIQTFNDSLLIIRQGNILLTFTGENLRLVNLSRRGSLLSGRVENIRIDRVGVK